MFIGCVQLLLISDNVLRVPPLYPLLYPLRPDETYDAFGWSSRLPMSVTSQCAAWPRQKVKFRNRTAALWIHVGGVSNLQGGAESHPRCT